MWWPKHGGVVSLPRVIVAAWLLSVPSTCRQQQAPVLPEEEMIWSRHHPHTGGALQKGEPPRTCLSSSLALSLRPSTQTSTHSLSK